MGQIDELEIVAAEIRGIDRERAGECSTVEAPARSAAAEQQVAEAEADQTAVDAPSSRIDNRWSSGASAVGEAS